MAYTYTSSVNSTGNSAIKFRMGYEVVSQGIVEGVPQSVINVVLQAERTNSSTTNKQSAATTMTIDGTANSKSLNFNVGGYTQNTWYTIWTISNQTITHDTATGQKSISLAFTINLSGTSAGGASHTWTGLALPTIPMGSTLALNATSYTISNATGPTVTATITRYNTSYYHQLVWKLGSTTIATQNAGQVASATRALTASAWLTQMTTSASAEGSCTLKTYSDSGYTTQVGVDSTVSFTVVCTRNPSIGTVTVATSGGISNVWVGGYSAAKVTAATVAGINGSTITKYEFLVNNAVAATYSSSAATYTWTSGVLNAGTYTFAVRVTDSRGRTATKSVTAITVNAYAAPKITAVSIFRCNSGGTAQEDGTSISVKATATATPAGNNITTFKVYTKLSSASTWTDKGTLTNGTAKVISTYAVTSSWTVKIEATDAIGTTSTYTTTIPTVSFTMDFKVGGRGVAFGKVAEENDLVDSAWAMRMPNPEVFDTLAFSRYRYVSFFHRSTNANVGEVRYHAGNYATPNAGQFSFLENSPGDAGLAGGGERYHLPAVASGLASVTNYNILTSKDPVTVAQGGTGADNADDARSNIGIRTKNYVFASGTARTFNVPANSRHILAIVGSVVTNNYGIWLMASTSGGTITTKEIAKGSGITLSVSGTTITVTSSGYGATLLDWALTGSTITPAE